MNDLDTYLRQLRKRKYQVKRSPGGRHWQVRNPAGDYIATVAVSTSSHRALDNLKTAVQRNQPRHVAARRES